MNAPRNVDSQNFQTLTPTCGAARLSIQCGGSGAILRAPKREGLVLESPPMRQKIPRVKDARKNAPEHDQIRHQILLVTPDALLPRLDTGLPDGRVGEY